MVQLYKKWDPMKINSPGSISELLSGNAVISYIGLKGKNMDE